MATSSSQEHLSLPVSIIVGSIIIGGSIIFAVANTSGRPNQAANPAPAAVAPVQQGNQQQNNARTADIKSVKASGAQVVGLPAAPITVAYWFDYQCPVCKSAEANVMSKIITEYVKTGKIRVVFKDLQFLGPDSASLGLAARAVGEVAPAKFYDWHKAVFENQGQENSGWATKEKILSITTSVLGKASADKVMLLMVSKAATYQKSLDADKAEGETFGINATPSFIIGNKLMVGLSSYENIKTTIEASIKK
ncbi:MAG: thioredoxin domain-containing protein [Candidatus Taylorbacteria bacterium]|nr:thioredoxin domain-containing protein [Candidatus Taylorbacteria bacterium]